MSARLTKGSRIDGDDFVELIMGIEEDFGVRFADDAFDDCLSVGDACDVVWAGLPRRLTSGGKCPSQMAFYRLRAAIGDPALRPDTPLRDVKGLCYVRLRETLDAQGWAMPARTPSLATLGLSVLAAILATAGLWPVIGPWALLGALIVLIVTVQWLHGRIFTVGWPSARTFGEVAHEMAYLNTNRLLLRGASYSRRMVWDRFVRVLGEDAHGPVVRQSGFY
ncbi:hypothetical protein [Asticcacaulis solisilvae]|uniref:hypothetical protein n=1 Tax=Asticcacaulis solisilvae TaxID=1217274 RepID=UPI003FD7A282